MPGRRAPLALLSLLVPIACGGLAASRVFEPIGDHETTSRPELAEGGHTPALVPPRGIQWAGQVLAFGDPDSGSDLEDHFELRLTIVDHLARAGVWRATPIAERMLLVDDEGTRLPCTWAVVPDEPAATGAGGAATATFRYRFPVPPGYRFRTIGGVSVHWELALDGTTPIPVTSRFRVQ